MPRRSAPSLQVRWYNFAAVLKRAWFFYLLAIFAVGGSAWVLLRGWAAFQQVSVVLEWSTATETESAGFNLYRATDPQGEFSQINANMIPPSGEPFLGGDYRFIDEMVVSGQTYYYELEEVQTNGVRVRIGRQVIIARRGGLVESILGGALLLLGVILSMVARAVRRGQFFTIEEPLLD